MGVPDECYDVINKLDADFVNTVRSVDSPYKDSRLLMIPTYAASQELHNLVKLEFPANDDYIAASVHAYSPYDFAMDARELMMNLLNHMKHILILCSRIFRQHLQTRISLL